MSTLTWRRVNSPADNTWQARLGRVVAFTLIADVPQTLDETLTGVYRCEWQLKSHLLGGQTERLVPMNQLDARKHAEVELERFLSLTGLVTPPESIDPSRAEQITDEVAKTLSGIIDEPWTTLRVEGARAAFTTTQQVRTYLGDVAGELVDGGGHTFAEFDLRLDDLLTEMRRLGWDREH